jgi:SPP1 gp7 family putative phage head morphogenesis protein
MDIKAKLLIDGDLTGNPENMGRIWKAITESTKIELDYNNPVPTDKQQNTQFAGDLYQKGILKLNEARSLVDFDPVDDSEGGEDFYKAPAPINPFGQKPEEPPPEPAKQLKKKSDEQWKESVWKRYVRQAESFEPKTIKALNEMFDSQKAEAVKNAREAVSTRNRLHQLLNLAKIKRQFTETMKPLLTEVVTNAVKNGKDLIKPDNPHTDSIKVSPPIDKPAQSVLDWLTGRMVLIAGLTSQETMYELAGILNDGFEQGLSMDDIAENITNATGFSAMRATRIARTEIMSASNAGAVSGYQSMGVNKVEWWTSEDERVCPECNDLHGFVCTVAESYGVAKPHLGINCRCVWLPYFGE